MGRQQRRAAARAAGLGVGAVPGAAEMREASGWFTAWREGRVPASWRRAVDDFGVRYTRGALVVRASMEPLETPDRWRVTLSASNATGPATTEEFHRVVAEFLDVAAVVCWVDSGRTARMAHAEVEVAVPAAELAANLRARPAPGSQAPPDRRPS